jgi:hypothetical protein
VASSGVREQSFLTINVQPQLADNTGKGLRRLYVGSHGFEGESHSPTPASDQKGIA